MLAESCDPLLVRPDGTRMCAVVRTGSLYTPRGWGPWMPTG